MILPKKMHELEEVDSEDHCLDSDLESDSAGSYVKKRKLLNIEDLPDSGKSKKLRKNKHLFSQPTTEELNQLRETENLFNSNLFRLQIEEVLKEVKLKHKTVERFQSWFKDLNSHFLNINTGEENSLQNLEWLQDLDVNLPIGLEPQETKGSFQFLKCSPPNIIGSYRLDCCLNKNILVDLVITIPAGFFVKNDSINHRYHRKRAIYLAIIASHLKTFDKISELKYTFLNGSKWKPAICITPKGKLGKDLQVVINLICDPESFKLARFHLARNNVREAWYFHKNETGVTEEYPTPFYNSSILQDLTSSVNEKFLENIILEKDNLKQAIVLLKIWIRQRKLPISGYVLSMFLAYLVQQKRINNIMSSYQIVRNTCIALINSEWDHKGISLTIAHNTDTPSIEDFHRHFPVVFVDCTGFYNICWRMTLGAYHALKYESSKAVELLDNQDINSFLPLFMTPFKLCLKYDHILRFHSYADVASKVYHTIPRDLKLDYGSETTFLTTKIITEMLRKGLGDRISYVCEYILNSDNNVSWPVTERIEDVTKLSNKKLNFLFGIKLNGEDALRLIDRGPPANLPEAESFRSFWGDKSELRRFQDGSITEACMWDANTLSERRLIVRSIVSHLLTSKYGIGDKNIIYIADQVECAIQARGAGTGWFVGEEVSLKAIEAFDQIRKELRALTDLPLDINSVTSTSPVSSYSDPCPPESIPDSDNSFKWKPLIRGKSQLIKDYMVHNKSIKHSISNKAIHAVVELGHSGKWPGDLDAFLRLKAAFNIYFADAIMKQCNLIAHPYPTHFNVLKNGFVFTFKLAHRKEINLRRRTLGPDGIVKYRDTDESLKLEYETIHLPRLRGALHGLHQQYSSYGAASCLAKQWLAAQLMDEAHFPPTLVELIVASTFVSPAPYAPPLQPLAAFLRFLCLISTTDWTAQPLIINFNNELSREEIAEQEKKFQDSRSSLPALFVITPYQGDTLSQWSKHGPSVNILARVRNLAEVTLQFIEKNLLLESESLTSIFRPNLDGYNVIIHLEWHVVAGAAHHRSKGDKQISVSVEGQSSIPVVEFDPVQKYLTELRNAYDPFALFFHNSYGGDLIAVLWKPDVLSSKEFKVSAVNGCKPKGNKQHELIVNIDAIIEDFSILGTGIVKSIELCSN